jgi:hypothetical protein
MEDGTPRPWSRPWFDWRGDPEAFERGFAEWDWRRDEP